jgi:hypothetical protein
MRRSAIAMGLGLSLWAPSLHAECETDELSLRWPMGGTDGVQWVINNYVDLDATTGLRDYRGNTGSLAKTYNGHNGIDVDLPNFRFMDARTEVRAAAGGTVTETQDNLFDRNMEAAPGCGPWNHVSIRHPNGFTTIYGHLRRDSVRVAVGDSVTTGQALGLIGSSGCSSTAHLHFEVRNCTNQVVEPFLAGMWSDPPAYDAPLRVMDITVRKGGFPDPAAVTPADALLKDPPLNALTIPFGGRIGIGLSTAGGGNGDRIDVLVRRPNGAVHNSFAPLTLTTPWRHGWPRWWVNLPSTGGLAGFWRVEVRVNNTLVRTHSFRMQATADEVPLAVHETAYQHTFHSLTDDSYRPAVVDGSGGPDGDARLSAIYRREGGGAFRTYHNLRGDDYQDVFDQAVAARLQLKHVDNYVRDVEPRIAAVFGPRTSNAWRAFHFLTRDQHQQLFNQLVSHGFRPYVISVAYLNGRHYVSSAYDDSRSRSWVALFGMDAAGYQAEVNRQQSQDRAPVYIDAYEQDGTARFSAIWTAEANDQPWVARHGLTEAQFFQFSADRARAGMRARSVTSYLSGGQRLFAGIWSSASF